MRAPGLQAWAQPPVVASQVVALWRSMEAAQVSEPAAAALVLPTAAALRAGAPHSQPTCYLRAALSEQTGAALARQAQAA